MSGTERELVTNLNTARMRHGISALAGAAMGGFLLINTNTLGQWLGYFLLAWGLYHGAWWILVTARGSARLVVNAQRTILPRTAYRGSFQEVATDEVKACYLLRHASPWHKAAPTLVIEAAGQAYLYPRDWFHGEADQRRIVDTLAAQRTAQAN